MTIELLRDARDEAWTAWTMADNAWMAALYARFGDDAPDARYQARGLETDELKALNDIADGYKRLYYVRQTRYCEAMDDADQARRIRDRFNLA